MPTKVDADRFSTRISQADANHVSGEKNTHGQLSTWNTLGTINPDC